MMIKQWLMLRISKGEINNEENRCDINGFCDPISVFSWRGIRMGWELVKRLQLPGAWLSDDH